MEIQHASYTVDDNEASDPHVDGSISDGEDDLPALAPDNRETWSVVADIAIRHIAQKDKTFVMEENYELEGAQTAPRLKGDALSTAAMSRVVLVNEDSHIPEPIRHPETAPYISRWMRIMSPSFVARPSEALRRGERMWHCPHSSCGYWEDLTWLSPRAGDAVCRVTACRIDSDFLNGRIASEFVHFVDGGRYGATDEFLLQVADIVGLRHYEAIHFRGVGLRCLIRGQNVDGTISYLWENKDLAKVLRSRSMDGASARAYEAFLRQRVHRSLANEARQWAYNTQIQALEALVSTRKDVRRSAHDFVRASPLFSNVFDVKLPFGKVARELSGAQSTAVLATARALHLHIYKGMDERGDRVAAARSVLPAAAEVLQVWEHFDDDWETPDTNAL